VTNPGSRCDTIPFQPEPWVAAGLALILDMDGVIIDSNPVHCEAWRAYNLRFGIHTDDATLHRTFGWHNDDIVQEYFGGGLDAEQVAIHGRGKERLYRELMVGQVEQSLVPGLRDFLRRHRGRAIGVASNAETANVDFIVKEAGLERYLRTTVTGDMVTHPKPHPEIYLKAAEALGAEPADCIVFEDSTSGVEAARKAGMRVVGLRTTHATLGDVDLLIDNFLSPELEPWLRVQKPR